MSAKSVSALGDLLLQQTSPIGFVAPRVQFDIAARGLDRALALGRDRRIAVAVVLFPRVGEPRPVALARGPLAASRSDDGAEG